MNEKIKTILVAVLAVITLALVIWVAVLLISDPKVVVRSVLLKKSA